MLSEDDKVAMIDYMIPEGEVPKGILEDTIIGDLRSAGLITEEALYDFIAEIRSVLFAHVKKESTDAV